MVGTSGRLDYWSQQVARRSSCSYMRPVTSLMEKIRWNQSNCCRGNGRLLKRFSAGDLKSVKIKTGMEHCHIIHIIQS